jgi:hypothetical protein
MRFRKVPMYKLEYQVPSEMSDAYVVSILHHWLSPFKPTQIMVFNAGVRGGSLPTPEYCSTYQVLQQVQTKSPPISLRSDTSVSLVHYYFSVELLCLKIIWHDVVRSKSSRTSKEGIEECNTTKLLSQAPLVAEIRFQQTQKCIIISSNSSNAKQI